MLKYSSISKKKRGGAFSHIEIASSENCRVHWFVLKNSRQLLLPNPHRRTRSGLQARPSVSDFSSWCSVGDPVRFFPKCQISTSVFGFDVGLPRLLVKVTAPIIHLWPQLASPGGGALNLMSLRVVYAVSGRNLMDSLEFLPNHSQASLPLRGSR